jgi:hypothetical protein
VRWCLSPEQSLSLHAGNWTVPGQLTARAPRAGNKVTKLPHGTSLLELRIALPGVADQKEERGLRLFSVESALIACSPIYFSNNTTDVRAVLPMIRDASGLLGRLLEGGHTVIAGRLAGAFRNMGRGRIADDIVKTMTAAGYAVRENNPFTDKPSLVIRARETSPYVNRLRLLWQKMREPIIERFPKAPGPPRNSEAYLKRVNDAYVTDAYHSLSIEGYQSRQILSSACAAAHGIRKPTRATANSGTPREEPHPAVRVVLGHFIFVYVHPYIDGNGRVGCFLMNAMMASGGYPWTVIPVTERNAYVNALEKASVGEDIAPFADFLAGLVKKRLAGEPLPAVPKASSVDER